MYGPPVFDRMGPLQTAATAADAAGPDDLAAYGSLPAAADAGLEPRLPDAPLHPQSCAISSCGATPWQTNASAAIAQTPFHEAWLVAAFMRMRGWARNPAFSRMRLHETLHQRKRAFTSGLTIFSMGQSPWDRATIASAADNAMSSRDFRSTPAACGVTTTLLM